MGASRRTDRDEVGLVACKGIPEIGGPVRNAEPAGHELGDLRGAPDKTDGVDPTIGERRRVPLPGEAGAVDDRLQFCHGDTFSLQAEQGKPPGDHYAMAVRT